MSSEDCRGLGVVILIDELHAWRGTETHLFRLGRQLSGLDIRPTLAVRGRASLAPAFRGAGLRVESLGIRRALGLSGLAGVVRIGRLIRRERASVVVTYHTAADLLGPLAARLAGVPVASSRRDEGFTKKPIHVALQRRLNRLLAGMIAVSDAVARAVVRSEGFDRDRIRVIWNGEDLAVFRPGEPRARPALGVPEAALAIICVAGLDPIKDHATLIRAFSRLRRRQPNVVLLLAGEGDERFSLEALAADLGEDVRFLGARDDVPDLLRASDVYAQASLSEGFSNSILQAMATGLPVVATSVGGNPELVDAKCGFLVPPGSPEALAVALEQLVVSSHLRRRMGATARSKVEHHASLEKCALSYAEAFREASSNALRRERLPRASSHV